MVTSVHSDRDLDLNTIGLAFEIEEPDRIDLYSRQILGETGVGLKLHLDAADGVIVERYR